MIALFLTTLFTASLAATPLSYTNQWNGGFQGTFTVHADHEVHGWKAHLIFDRPIDSLEVITNFCMVLSSYLSTALKVCIFERYTLFETEIVLLSN